MASYFGNTNNYAEIHIDLVNKKVSFGYKEKLNMINRVGGLATFFMSVMLRVVGTISIILLYFLWHDLNLLLSIVFVMLIIGYLISIFFGIILQPWYFQLQKLIPIWMQYVTTYPFFNMNVFETTSSESNIIEITGYKNIHYDYELTGEFSKYFIYFKAVRHKPMKKQYNMFSKKEFEFEDSGKIHDKWKMIFTFSQPPKTGKLKVKYV